MPHPDIRVPKGLEFEPLFLADEEGRPIVVTLAKATFALGPNGALSPADEPLPISFDGELRGDPAGSSHKYEPETAFVKPATDVVLIGHAHAPKAGTDVIDVGIKVGPVQKIVRVFGDRQWVKDGGQIITTRPRPFERIPLIYERAFGGWDKSAADESRWTFEPRNPVGRGFDGSLRAAASGAVPLPNIEDPAALIRNYGDRPPPAGVGFVAPHWQPRAQYAGTYDEAWQAQRKPLLPTNFDRRFFNAASPGLIAPGFLRGDEEVIVVNAAATPQLRFRLPGVPPPICDLHFRKRPAERLPTRLDTVIVNTDDNLLLMLWRNYAVVPGGPHEVVAIEVAAGR